MNKIVEMIEKEYMKQEVPQFEVGDTVKVTIVSMTTYGASKEREKDFRLLKALLSQRKTAA